MTKLTLMANLTFWLNSASFPADGFVCRAYCDEISTVVQVQVQRDEGRTGISGATSPGRKRKSQSQRDGERVATPGLTSSRHRSGVVENFIHFEESILDRGR